MSDTPEQRILWTDTAQGAALRLGAEEIRNLRAENERLRALLDPDNDTAVGIFSDAYEAHSVGVPYDAEKGMVTGPAQCEACTRTFGYEGSPEYEDAYYHAVRMGLAALREEAGDE